MVEENLDLRKVHLIIETALIEDIGSGDITSDNLIAPDKKRKAYLLLKEGGIVAGLPIAELVFKKLDPDIKWYPKCEDGSRVKAGTNLVEFEGALRGLLTGERTALNFLQRMSGIATLTSKFVDRLKDTETKILDTRKTVPGLRILDKYAVRIGGGTNHRYGLFDMVIVKDNHIKAAGSIKNAVAMIKPNIQPGIKIEVEAANLDQVEEALSAGADIIMLDNMTVAMMREAAKMVDGRVKIEASGSVRIDNIKEISETGVDFISVGALTHSVKTLDIGMYIL